MDPKAYIQTNHPSALLLDTHAVKESIWSIIDASVEDSISNLSWIDIKVLLTRTRDGEHFFCHLKPVLISFNDNFLTLAPCTHAIDQRGSLKSPQTTPES